MLKLAKLPNRTPTKITITVNADLSQSLSDYQKLYVATYETSEKITDRSAGKRFTGSFSFPFHPLYTGGLPQ